jgi:hypothetical protein
MDMRIILDTLAILMTGGSEGRKRDRAVGARQRPVLPGLTFRRPVAPAREGATTSTVSVASSVSIVPNQADSR